jgi:c-di-AMP phosphodiesterase-like protein
MAVMKNWTDSYYGLEHYKHTHKSIYITVDTRDNFVLGTINNHNEGGGGFTNPVARLVGKSTENMKKRLIKIAKKNNLIYQ